MKNLITLICLIVISSVSAFAEVGTISTSQAAEKQKAGALIVDVRSGEEYHSGHVEGAINIPHDQIEKELSKIGADKEKEIVLYCKSGRRAGIALASLARFGYSNVSNAGGYEDLAKVLPVVKQ